MKQRITLPAAAVKARVFSLKMGLLLNTFTGEGVFYQDHILDFVLGFPELVMTHRGMCVCSTDEPMSLVRRQRTPRAQLRSEQEDTLMESWDSLTKFNQCQRGRISNMGFEGDIFDEFLQRQGRMAAGGTALNPPRSPPPSLPYPHAAPPLNPAPSPPPPPAPPEVL